MDVPLALNNIGIRHGFERYKRKPSVYSHLADIVAFVFKVFHIKGVC